MWEGGAQKVWRVCSLWGAWGAAAMATFYVAAHKEGRR